MNFSIIIVNYNYKNITKDSIDSIFKSCKKDDFEIIVVDNYSTDDSTNFLYRYYGNKIKIIKNKKNFGFAKACNQGAEIAKGRYLFFLNNDTIIDADILPALNTAFDDEKVGAISPVLLTLKRDKQKYAYGAFPSFFNLFFKRNKKINTDKIDWFSGASLLVRKDIFKKVNGFDENFFMYFEDIDLCRRIRDLGYSLKLVTDAVLVHLGGKSIKIPQERKKYYYKSQDYFYKKYYGSGVVLVIRIFRFLYKILLSK